MPYSLPSGILVYRFGERGSGFRSKTGKVLDYYEIKKEACGPSGNKLFTDINFPCEDSSIFPKSPVHPPVEWKRPSEIVSNPAFFSDGVSRFDVCQGELGNCWFLAAVANLTLNKELFHLVVPEDNGSFSDKEYNGAFHFRFWKFGRWVDVVIDDRLPTRNGRLVFMQSQDKTEFWSALIEKAYAKQHGSYEALVGGNMTEAMEDFTGGVTEICKVAEDNEKYLFQLMTKAFMRSSFMGCSLDSEPGVIEGKGPLGLIRGHAYSITDVKIVEIPTTATAAVRTRRYGDGLSSNRYVPATTKKNKTVELIRVRNPWGKSEWEGAWSDSSKEWDLLKNTPHQIDLSFKSDGEFWISYADFKTHFTNLDICHLDADVLDELDNLKGKQEQENVAMGKKRKWVSNSFQGSWVKGVSAGGCRNFRDTFPLNPQYLIELTDPDEDDDDPDCTVIVALMQKFRRKMGQSFLPIGFTIYPVKKDYPKQTTPLDETFFRRNFPIQNPLKFTNCREVSARFKLSPGTYCIVPSTFNPNEECEFILRVFTEAKVDMKENDEAVDVFLPDDAKLKNGDDDNKRKQLATPAGGTTDNDDGKGSKKALAFFKLVAGPDLEVNWEELKSLLDSTFTTKFEFHGFSKDVCRSMISMMDADRSGKLGFDEFQDLWNSIDTWKMVFIRFDKDKSGTLDSSELREALTSSGFKVNHKTLQTILLRYADKDGVLKFDDFIMCGLRLKYLIEIFKEGVPDGGKACTFTMDEWIEKTLYS